jgi:hypothetical protein
MSQFGAQKGRDHEKELNEHEKGIRSSIEYFSNKNKPKREHWVVKKFLKAFDVDFSEEEIRSCKDDPPDIIFREARIEIKEILDPDRKRHDEYKKALVKVRKAKKIKDLFEFYSPKIISVSELINIISSKIEGYEKKYSSDNTRNLDLLIYFNMLDYEVIQEDIGNMKTDFCHKWRSVSVLTNESAFVLYAKNSAPDFIKKNVLNYSGPQQNPV